MRWQMKARIQRIVARLPQDMGERVYYRIQRTVGAFRSLDPWDHFSAARRIAEAATRHGKPIAGAEILEVGTGHRLLVPIGFWLLGAKRIVTVDVHRYLKGELVLQDLEKIALDPSRARSALSFPGGEVSKERLESLCQMPQKILGGGALIEYRAPADAGDLHDAAGTYDLHVSRSVLEHVPSYEITRIVTESKRVLRRSGLFIHLIDFSDHFAHVDNSISSIHFLRFSDNEWQCLAGNQFAFHNRLRSDDFEHLLQKSGLTLVESSLTIDENALSELEKTFPLSTRFKGRDPVRLAHREGFSCCAGMWIPARDELGSARSRGNTARERRSVRVAFASPASAALPRIFARSSLPYLNTLSFCTDVKPPASRRAK